MYFQAEHPAPFIACCCVKQKGMNTSLLMQVRRSCTTSPTTIQFISLFALLAGMRGKFMSDDSR
jgi:hypothetical protein